MSSIRPENEPSKTPEPEASVDQLEMQDVHGLHAPIMREQAEPRDGFEPVPSWLTIFYGVIVFCGGYYLASYNGGFRPDVYNERRPLRMASAESVTIDPLQRGQRLFTVNCSACHQSTGQGVSGQFPPLAGSQWVVGDYGRLVRILLHGLEGPLEVLGETYNGNMPAFGNKLDDEQLGLVLSYIRQAWGNTAPPISSEVIANIRSEFVQPRNAWTAAELLEIESPPLSTITPTSGEGREETGDDPSMETQDSDSAEGTQ
jgi:mono/diheme cytochrome c family protein